MKSTDLAGMHCITSMQSPRSTLLRSWSVVNVMASSCLFAVDAA
jgi:hypothetical protein